MEKSNCEALRKLARQAKNRLGRKNYFEKGGYKVFSKGLLADYKLVHLSTREDENFYKKVCDILNENFDAINPLGQLVDKLKLENMNNSERERYMINLADKYIKMKSRFEKEREVEFAG